MGIFSLTNVTKNITVSNIKGWKYPDCNIHNVMKKLNWNKNDTIISFDGETMYILIYYAKDNKFKFLEINDQPDDYSLNEKKERIVVDY